MALQPFTQGVELKSVTPQSGQSQNLSRHVSALARSRNQQSFELLAVAVASACTASGADFSIHLVAFLQKSLAVVFDTPLSTVQHECK